MLLEFDREGYFQIGMLITFGTISDCPCFTFRIFQRLGFGSVSCRARV